MPASGLHQNAERYLKPIKEMQRLFRQYPDAIQRTQEIAQACQFSLDELKYVYPEEITTEGRTPQEELVYLAWKGANEKLRTTIYLKISERPFSMSWTSWSERTMLPTFSQL